MAHTFLFDENLFWKVCFHKLNFEKLKRKNNNNGILDSCIYEMRVIFSNVSFAIAAMSKSMIAIRT